MFDFSEIKRIAASIAGAAILSATCIFTAIAPARAGTVADVAGHSRPVIVAELAVASVARS